MIPAGNTRTRTSPAAAAITPSGSKPYFLCYSLSGAEAPNVFMPDPTRRRGVPNSLRALVMHNGSSASNHGRPRRLLPLAGAVLEHAGDQRGPPGLVVGPQPLSGVAVEVLVEPHEVPPERVVGEAPLRSLARPDPGGVSLDQSPQPLA